MGEFVHVALYHLIHVLFGIPLCIQPSIPCVQRGMETGSTYFLIQISVMNGM